MNRPNVRGRGRGMSKAQSVLSRASSQLKGEQVTSRDEKDDDDVGAYLSALTKRTNVQPQWDKLGNAADLSESDDDRNAPPTVDTVASKFLKKKPAAVAQSAQGAKYPKREARPSVMGQSGGGGAGSLLDKAAVYTEKYSSHAAAGRGEILHLSESDMDLSFSLDDSIVAEVTPVKMTTGKPGQKPTNRVDSSGSSGEDEEKVSVSQRFHRAKSIESEDDSMVIGKGGNRFLKKKKPEPGSSLQKEKEATTKKKKSAVTGVNVRGIEKFSTHLMLDSDEESMQGYIQNLSDLASTPRSPTPKTPRSIKTPRSLTTMEDISEEAEMSRSEPRHQLKSDDASQSSNDSFKINVMDLNVLEPVPLVISPPGRDDGTTGRVKKQKFSQSDSGKTDHSGKKSEKRVSDKTKRKKTSTKSNYEMPRRKDKDGKKTSEKEVKKTSSFFSSMGLHTVDELFGVDEDKVSDVSEVSSSVQPSEQPTYDYHAALASRSILSGSSRPITPKSSRSHVRLSLNDEITEIRSRSPSPEAISTARPSHASTVYTEDFESESVTEHASSYTRSGAESENSASSYTSSRSVSSHRSSCSSRSIRSTRSTRSSRSKATTARSDDGYSDDFGTESSHRSERSHSPVTESGDNRSMSSMVRPRRRPKVKQRNAAIQTGVDLEAGLIYHWNVENSVTVVGQQYGLGYVDPTPIATHVVSADALEAMTAYNPSTVALNDMLRQQLRLTTDFIEAQKQLHRHLLGSLAMQHHYTTLADTKKYIKQHRKPKLTFDEALRQVKEEMALQ